jgi:hypothetical protein
MDKQVQKRLTTQTQVRMEIEEVEHVLLQHLGFKQGLGCDVRWRVSENCVDRVTITATEESEVE